MILDPYSRVNLQRLLYVLERYFTSLTSSPRPILNPFLEHVGSLLDPVELG